MCCPWVDCLGDGVNAGVCVTDARRGGGWVGVDGWAASGGRVHPGVVGMTVLEETFWYSTGGAVGLRRHTGE